MLCSPRLRTASLALPLAFSLVVAACSGGGGDKSSSTTRRATTTTTVAPVAITLGGAHVESAGPDVKLDARTQQAILAATKNYVAGAILGPLRSGRIGAAYVGLFDGNVQRQARTTDREALTDITVGKASKGFTTKVTPVRIEGVADQAGKVLYLASIFQVHTTTTTPSGPVSINRAVELTFMPEPRKWKVTAYRALTTRKSAAGTTTTTARSGSTPTTKKKKP